MKADGHCFAAASLVCSIAISCALILLPAYTTGSQSLTLLQVNGLQGIAVLLLPVILSLLGMPESQGLRILAGFALLIFGFLIAIGLFYLPGAVLLCVAAYRTRKQEPAQTTLLS